jgi:hypothetical protein
MFSKNEVVKMKETVEYAKRLRERLNRYEFGVQMDNGDGAEGFISFHDLPKYDKIVEGKNRIQLQFKRLFPGSPETEDLGEIVNKNVPFIKPNDIKNVLKSLDKYLGTVKEKTYLINNIKFVETGISEKGWYINILCNPDTVKVNYVNGERDLIIIVPDYNEVADEVGVPKFDGEVFKVTYNEKEMDNPFYQSAVEAIKIGTKKMGFVPVIETGKVNGFNITNLPKNLPLNKLYKFAPQLIALVK